MYSLHIYYIGRSSICNTGVYPILHMHCICRNIDVIDL